MLEDGLGITHNRGHWVVAHTLMLRMKLRPSVWLISTCLLDPYRLLPMLNHLLIW